MGIFDGVLLASDFDNTLLNTDIPRRTGCAVPPVSPGNRAALEHFMAEGGRFAVATGRALPAFAAFAHEVPMNAPGIVCNGAALYDFQAEVYLETILLPPDVRQWGQAVLERFPTLALEAYHVENVIHAVRPNLYTRQHQHVTHVEVVETPSLTQVPLPLGKIMFEESHDILQQVREWIMLRPWAADLEVFFSDRSLLEVTRKGASKGGMVERLARRLGISMEHVYCVGDENNDLSMLRAAAQGFAPANCVEAVRASGAVIVADCDHDTLADVVARLETRYALGG